MRAIASCAVLLAAAGCGTRRDAEFEHRLPLYDHGLVVWLSGDQVLGAEHGCTERSCTSLLTTKVPGMSGLSVEPFHAHGWYLLSFDVTSDGDFGGGSGRSGELFHRGDPPTKTSCALFFYGRGCSYEYGWCQQSEGTLTPLTDDWTVFDERDTTSYAGNGDKSDEARCTRFTLSSDGTCAHAALDCASYGAP